MSSSFHVFLTWGCSLTDLIRRVCVQFHLSKRQLGQTGLGSLVSASLALGSQARLFMWLPGSKFGSSCLCSRYFSNWAIFPRPSIRFCINAFFISSNVAFSSQPFIIYYFPDKKQVHVSAVENFVGNPAKSGPQRNDTQRNCLHEARRNRVQHDSAARTGSNFESPDRDSLFFRHLSTVQFWKNKKKPKL